MKQPINVTINPDDYEEVQVVGGFRTESYEAYITGYGIVKKTFGGEKEKLVFRVELDDGLVAHDFLIPPLKKGSDEPCRPKDLPEYSDLGKLFNIMKHKGVSVVAHKQWLNVMIAPDITGAYLKMEAVQKPDTGNAAAMAAATVTGGEVKVKMNTNWIPLDFVLPGNISTAPIVTDPIPAPAPSEPAPAPEIPKAPVKKAKASDNGKAGEVAASTGATKLQDVKDLILEILSNGWTDDTPGSTIAAGTYPFSKLLSFTKDAITDENVKKFHNMNRRKAIDELVKEGLIVELAGSMLKLA